MESSCILMRAQERVPEFAEGQKRGRELVDEGIKADANYNH